MRRPYGPEVFARIVERLARTLTDPGIGADIIAGFPGEREADFEESVSLIRSLPLTYLHVFPFSPRPGTPAAAMKNQVPVPERDRRAGVLRELSREKTAAFHERHIGRTVQALIQGQPGCKRGATHEDVGGFRNLRITRHEGGKLHGEFCD